MFALYLVVFVLTIVSGERSFTIDYNRNCFLKDGQPFRYISGSLHYFRVPQGLWADRLSKMKLAGLNAVQTYVEWSQHEPEPGTYNFEGDYDLVNFIQTAQSQDLLVILRPGPFIDAERDMGGLPYWLMRINPEMKLRTYDRSYIKYMDHWYDILLPMIRPLLYKNGGPIIMVQIENEYGSLGVCDAQYTSHLRDLFRYHFKDDVLVFTTDGSNTRILTCGRIDQVFQTIDFGAGEDPFSLFNMFRWHQGSGPLVNSEFYSGWLDHWGHPHANVTTEVFSKALYNVLAFNASVNMYMFHGGTSFGFTAGSDLENNKLLVCPTSYDYDAPLSEAGDPTPKYYKIRETIGQFAPLPPGPIPVPAPKLSIGPIQLNKVIQLWDITSVLNSLTAQYPVSFEDLKQPYGFVLYETVINHIPTDPALLTIPNIADRGYVFVNQVLQGILSREQSIQSMPLKILKGQTLMVLVENQGRVCFGAGVLDRKGIFQNVTLGSTILRPWTMTPIPLDSISIEAIENMMDNLLNVKDSSSTPAIFSGEFNIDEDIYDTFLNMDGWHKGVAFINGFNVGRYWPIIGPQVTLYVPQTILKKGSNKISLLELEHSPCETEISCIVNLVQEPIVNGTTPRSSISKRK